MKCDGIGTLEGIMFYFSFQKRSNLVGEGGRDAFGVNFDQTDKDQLDNPALSAKLVAAKGRTLELTSWGFFTSSQCRRDLMFRDIGF